MKNIAAICLFIFFALLTLACNENDYTHKGTVRYIQVEGGFYGIEGDDGQKYDPVNLSKEFQKDGLRIAFSFNDKKDIMSVHMWGKIIEITKIKKL